MNTVAAVVVTYNRINLLKACLAALQNQSCACDILLIDNASSDGTEAWVRGELSKYSNIYYFNTGRNIGGAGGFNCGMRKAAEMGYEYIWLMDDDCLPEVKALENLLSADSLLKGQYGWLSSSVLWKDGHECKMNRQKLKKSFYEYLEYLQYGLVQAEQATFVSLFLKKEVVYRVGLPVKEFFIWGDDIEYTRRIAVRNRLPCFVAGKSIVIHAMQENGGSSIAEDNLDRLSRYGYAFRNECYLYRQEGIRGVFYYIARCGCNFLKIIFKAENYKIKRLRILLTGMFKGAFFNPQIEHIKNNDIRM